MMENDFDLVEFLQEHKAIASLIQLSLEDISRELRKYWETMAECLRNLDMDDKLARKQADFYSDLNICLYQIISDSLTLKVKMIEYEMEELRDGEAEER